VAKSKTFSLNWLNSSVKLIFRSRQGQPVAPNEELSWLQDFGAPLFRKNAGPILLLVVIV